MAATNVNIPTMASLDTPLLLLEPPPLAELTLPTSTNTEDTHLEESQEYPAILLPYADWSEKENHYYYDPPPLDIPLAQPLPDDDIQNETEDEPQGIWVQPTIVREPDGTYQGLGVMVEDDDQMEVDTQMVDLAMIEGRRRRRNKRKRSHTSTTDDLQTLCATVTTLIQEEHRMHLTNLQNLERLCRHCIRLSMNAKMHPRKTLHRHRREQAATARNRLIIPRPRSRVHVVKDSEDESGRDAMSAAHPERPAPAASVSVPSSTQCTSDEEDVEEITEDINTILNRVRPGSL